MQVWDIVKVDAVDNELDGKAGIVIRSHPAKEIAVVKLDELPEPVSFAFSELQVLGR